MALKLLSQNCNGKGKASDRHFMTKSIIEESDPDIAFLQEVTSRQEIVTEFLEKEKNYRTIAVQESNIYNVIAVKNCRKLQVQEIDRAVLLELNVKLKNEPEALDLARLVVVKVKFRHKGHVKNNEANQNHYLRAIHSVLVPFAVS